jgi:hypothetical protein
MRDQMPRGKRGKLKKLEKYKDQDEDERKMKLKLLGVFIKINVGKRNDNI